MGQVGLVDYFAPSVAPPLISTNIYTSHQKFALLLLNILILFLLLFVLPTLIFLSLSKDFIEKEQIGRRKLST